MRHGKPEIGFVFQEPTLMPWADALTNARLPLDLKRVPRGEADARAAAALARVGLAGFERAYPRELSGGMKMRVSIARALGGAAANCCCWTSLSPPWTRSPATALGDDLLQLWREDGLTVIFVTHSVSESSYLSEPRAGDDAAPRPHRRRHRAAGRPRQPAFALPPSRPSA